MDTDGESDLSPCPAEHDNGDPQSNLVVNISDVIEAISIADPSTVEAICIGDPPPGAPADMYPAGGPSPAAPAHAAPQPYIKIIEEPAERSLRFRYECEGRSAGSIPGVNSTADRKTYPTIQICGYKGNAIVVVSLVSKDPEPSQSPVKKYRPHPHNLVGRERCKNGVCTADVCGENPTVSFSNLGIQCVKRKDIVSSLELREKIRVDPFKTGFAHKSQPQSVDLNAVRLCFQVFLLDSNGHVYKYLEPAVSQLVYDKKAMSDLAITRLSRATGSVAGDEELILLCEKLREEVDVMFFEEESGVRSWESAARTVLVHKQVAVVFATPPYRGGDSGTNHKVFIQLRRRSDGRCSEPVSFLYEAKRAEARRRKLPHPSLAQYYDTEMGHEDKHIKLEPRDKTPPHKISSPPVPFPQEFEQLQPTTVRNLQQWVPGISHNPFATAAGLYAVGPSRDAYSPVGAPYAHAHGGMSVAHGGLSMAHGGLPTAHGGLPAAHGGLPAAHGGLPVTHGSLPAPHYAPPGPGMRTLSPAAHHAAVSPGPHAAMSPTMDHSSPSMSPNVIMTSNMTATSYQMNQPSYMDTGNDSLQLMLDRDDMPDLNINSGELSGLASFLAERSEMGSDLITPAHSKQ